MKFEVFHRARDLTSVRCVVENGFFMFSIDLQGLSPQLQFYYLQSHLCGRESEMEKERERMNHMFRGHYAGWRIAAQPQCA